MYRRFLKLEFKFGVICFENVAEFKLYRMYGRLSTFLRESLGGISFLEHFLKVFEGVEFWCSKTPV